ncbi:MAG: PAS domain S-box protein [Hyphomicrobiaceae bacterium]
MPALTLDGLGDTIVAAAPDAILHTDRDGIIRLWNAGCERIFGFPAAEALGQPLDIIIPENLRARHHEGHGETMRSGHTKYGSGDLLSVPALRKDGTRISVEFCIIPFRDARGAITGLAAIMRDVTRRFDELKALRKQLAAHAGQRDNPPS